MTQLREIGVTDMKSPRLVLGGNVFGWTADKDRSFALLDRFVELGGTMIDTADVYSNWVEGHKGGESERVIGEWLKHSGKRDQVLIATKMGYRSDATGNLDPDYIAEACDASLHRLGIERIDLYYAHKDDESRPVQEPLEAFARLIDAGKVRHLGASNFHAARLKAALDAARDDGLPHYRVLQPEYNLVSRTKFEGELQNLCVEHNIAALPYFGLAAGFLTGKYRTEADLSKSPRGGGMGELIRTKAGVLEALDAVAAETGASLPQIALAWLAAQPGVTAPIASATSIEQLEELAGAFALELTPDQIERLTVAGA